MSLNQMEFKSDWPEAAQRLSDLWNGRPLDRPCIAVTAPYDRGFMPKDPAREYTPEEKWLAPDIVLHYLRSRMQGTWWGGEAIPAHLLMSGWILSAGGSPHFSWNTIWFDTRPVDFSKPSPFVMTPGDPWVEKHNRLYLATLEAAAPDRFMLGQPVTLPATDLLSMHMGTENFLMALLDEPEWMQKAISEANRQIHQECHKLASLAKAKTPYWYGMAGWMTFWAPEPYFATQCDVSCMMSPETYNDFVLPELEFMHQQYGPLWYHLDGGDAKQHLPTLLSLPYLRVIQYTPAPNEPVNGPGHLEMYRAIQAAGKIVHIDVPVQNVEPLVRKLDTQFLMLNTHCGSIQEGESLLASVK